MAKKKGVSVNAYIRCADAGMSKLEAAKEIGVSVQCVHAMSKKYGIKFLDGRSRRKSSIEQT